MAAPKLAKNLRILRDSLNLSQAQMGAALGGFSQSTYNMWERGSQPPTEVRENLSSAGVDLHWLETGEGNMFRAGIQRIQVIRDEKTGKAKALKPVMAGAPSERPLVHEAQPGTGIYDIIEQHIEEAVALLASRGIRPSDKEGDRKLRKLIWDALEAGKESPEPLADRVERWIRSAEAIRK